jgi:hypothetical protein
MGVVPGPVTVRLVAVMVVGSIASLKVTAILLLTGTPVELQEGARADTVGGVPGAVAPVVKLHTKLAAIGVPRVDSAPVVTVKVMSVFGGRETDGANFAVLLAAV